MPPKKINVQSQIKPEISKKNIIIKKTEGKTETKDAKNPQVNLITSKTKIVEPIVHDSNEFENIDENVEEIEDDNNDKVENAKEKDNEDVDEEGDDEEVDDEELEEEGEGEEGGEEVEEEGEDDKEDVSKINNPINIVKIIEPIKKKPIQNIKDTIKDTIKDNNKEKAKNKEKDKDNKVHNHSKPKTIIASTTDINTVDMFGEDDLDFRYVMMNYDYTKNITIPKITKYERALLIGKRAKQIEEGANPNVKYISGQSVISIAEEELRQRKIPLIIKRPIGNKFEYWKPADMEVNMD